MSEPTPGTGGAQAQRVLLLGATGATGGHVLDQALAAGLAVTALVRDPTRLDPRNNLTVLAGDATNADDVTAAMTGVDAVISTLGRGVATQATTLIHDATTALLAAAERTGVRRVVFLSSYGVGRSRETASWFARLLYAGPARRVYADKAEGEKLLESSGLDWTLLYPVNLTNGPEQANLKTIDLDDLTRPPGPGLIPRVSRADVATTILTAINTPTWHQKTIVITRHR